METIMLAALALWLAVLASGRFAFPRWTKIAGWVGIICMVVGVACLIVEILVQR